MKAAYIDGFTHDLGQPEGWDEAKHGKCLNLPVRMEPCGDTVAAVSAWQPTTDELAALIAGAKINLRVIGGQPPVSLWVDGVNETLEPATPNATEQRMLLMMKVLRLCRKQFASYVESHRAKRTAEGDAKAETNATFAKLCADVLDGLPGEASR